MREDNKPLKPLDEPTIIQHAQEWLNDHGHPSYSYLKKLAEDDTIESRDQLLELAQNYDIQFDRSTTTQELIERIRLYMDLGPNLA
jgi:hypothetical protein